MEDAPGDRTVADSDLGHPPFAVPPSEKDVNAEVRPRRRRTPDTAVPLPSNSVLAAHRALMALPVGERRAVVTDPDGAKRLVAAGITGEAPAGCRARWTRRHGKPSFRPWVRWRSSGRMVPLLEAARDATWPWAA
jgi:hypothetical protein